jgi:hypothetical protein
MDTTLARFTLRFQPGAGAVKPNQQPRRAQPVRLPQATAELVDRMLTARCGSAH